MAKTLLIMGESGAGKTTSLRNLDPNTTFIIDCDKKGLSWKGWKNQYSVDKKNYYKTDHATVVSNILKKIDTQDDMKHIKTVVIDTINGIMVGEEISIMKMSTGDKRARWADLAEHVWSLIDDTLSMRDDLTIICIAHSETISDDNGIVKTRVKTNGRKLEKMVLESKFTTVLYTTRKDGKHYFITAEENNTAKVPLGAFDGKTEIPNDVVLVLKELEDF